MLANIFAPIWQSIWAQQISSFFCYTCPLRCRVLLINFRRDQDRLSYVHYFCVIELYLNLVYYLDYWFQYMALWYKDRLYFVLYSVSSCSLWISEVESEQISFDLVSLLLILFEVYLHINIFLLTPWTIYVTINRTLRNSKLFRTNMLHEQEY